MNGVSALRHIQRKRPRYYPIGCGGVTTEKFHESFPASCILLAGLYSSLKQ